MRSRSAVFGRRQQADVVTGRDAARLDDESPDLLLEAFREDVVQEHRVDAAHHEIGIGMGVVLVRHRHHRVLACGAEQDFVGDRAGQRRDAAAAQVGERPVALRIGRANAQDFPESVVRNRRGQRRAVGRRVLDAVQAEVRIAAGDRLGEVRERDVDEARRAAQTAGQQIGDLDLETDDAIRVGRVGLDIGRAALGIAGPDQFGRRIGGGQGGGEECGTTKDTQGHEQHQGHRGSNPYGTDLPLVSVVSFWWSVSEPKHARERCGSRWRLSGSSRTARR